MQEHLLSVTDLIHFYWQDIEAAFQQLGGIAPHPNALHLSEKWSYCATESPKDKGKIGYRCTAGSTGSPATPFFSITVNSFKHGGESVSFTTRGKKDHLEQYKNTSTGKKRYLRIEDLEAPRHAVVQRHDQRGKQRAQIAAREAEKRAQRQAKYRFYCKAWEAAGTGWENKADVAQHPYVLKKGITCRDTLRQLPNRSIAYPLQDIDGQRQGIQLIFPNGNKLIFGQKKGCFAVLGDLKATTLYLCEGYATGNAVHSLVSARQKRAAPIAVIICLDAHNLIYVASQFRAQAGKKKLVICADNDHESHAQKGIHNTGLLAGYEAAIQTGSAVKIPPSESGVSDWCDAWLRDKKATLACFAKKTHKPVLDYHLSRLAAFKAGDTSVSYKKALQRTVGVLVKKHPSDLSAKEGSALLQEATQTSGIGASEVTARWQRAIRRQQGMAMRAQSVCRTQAEPVQTITCDAIGALFNTVTELKKTHPKAIFVTNAPMGSGKTQQFMQPAFAEAEQKTHIPVVITPSRSLTQGVAERFEAAHYITDEVLTQDAQYNDTIPASLAITINSIIAPRFKPLFDFTQAIFIDEYTQVLRAICHGTVKNHQRCQTEKRLASLINQSRYTYIADADMHQTALDHLVELTQGDRPIFLLSLKETNPTPQAPAENKTPVPADAPLLNNNANGESVTIDSVMTHVSPRLPAALNNPITYTLSHGDDRRHSKPLLLQAMIDALKRPKEGTSTPSEKHRFYVVSDSKQQLDRIEHALKKKARRVRVLKLTSDTINYQSALDFIDNPDAYLSATQPDVVLVSPAIQSGVSIESDYFDRGVAFYTGVVTPVVMQQMMHRVRALTHFEVSLPTLKTYQSLALEDANAILLAHYEQHLKQFPTEHCFDVKNQATGIGPITLKQENGRLTITGDDDYVRYEHLNAQLMALDTQQRHNAGNFFLIQAEQRGVVLKKKGDPTDEFSVCRAKQNAKDINKAHQQQRIDDLVGACTLSDDEYQQLQADGGATSEAVTLDVERYDIKKALHVKDALGKQDIDFYRQKGHRHVGNYHALLRGEEAAQSNDAKDREAGVAKTNAAWRVEKVNLLQRIFNTLELDPVTGSGSYTTTQAKRCRSDIQKSEALCRYSLFKLGLNARSRLSDVKYVNLVLKNLLGLGTSSVQIREGAQRKRCYSIEASDLEQLRHYYALRIGQPLAIPVEQFYQDSNLLLRQCVNGEEGSCHR